MNYRNRLPSFAFEGNSLWYLEPTKLMYIKGKIVKIDRLQSKIRMRIEPPFIALLNTNEIEVPFDLAEEASNDAFVSRDIADLSLINLPEILRFFDFVIANPPPYFSMTRTVGYLSPGPVSNGQGKKVQETFDVARYQEIINNRFFELSKTECDLNLFLSRIFNQIRTDHCPKHLFLMGKSVDVNKAQRKRVFEYIMRTFEAPDDNFFPTLKNGLKLFELLTTNVNVSGNTQLFAFYRIKIDLEVGNQLKLSGGQLQFINLYASFLAPPAEGQVTTELPLALLFPKFYVEKNPSELKDLAHMFPPLLVPFPDSIILKAKKAFAQFTQSLQVS